MIKVMDKLYRLFFYDNVQDDENINETLVENEEKLCEPSVDSPHFSRDVLDALRDDVGRFPAERGGLLGSKSDPKLIDLYCFDIKSRNTSASYDYDVEYMSLLFNKWKQKGYVAHSFIHSHPNYLNTPSYPDIVSAYVHMKFFGNDFFYIPIVQSEPRGFYTLYFYIARLIDDIVYVHREYVIKATSQGYEYIPFEEWERTSTVEEILEYRNRYNPKKERVHKKVVNSKKISFIHPIKAKKKSMEQCKVFDVKFVGESLRENDQGYKLYIVPSISTDGKRVMKAYALSSEQYQMYLKGKCLEESKLKLCCEFSQENREENKNE